MIEIHKLNIDDYKGKKYTFEYITPGYYDLIAEDEFSFRFDYKRFSEPQNKSFVDELASDWLEKPILLGIFNNEQFAGFIEGSIETWNNRFRISNLMVFKEYRKQHLSVQLMNAITKEAKKYNVRMLVLEVLSCNVPAIQCYMKRGFKIIGFDAYAFSNNDIKNHEIRIEMGKLIES